MQMETSMKANGRMIKARDMEFTYILMELSTKENG